MQFCVSHMNKDYTVEEFEKLDNFGICLDAGVYQDASSGLIHIYCFVCLSNRECPIESKG